MKQEQQKDYGARRSKLSELDIPNPLPIA
jgi:hypothetical protein